VVLIWRLIPVLSLGIFAACISLCAHFKLTSKERFSIMIVNFSAITLFPKIIPRDANLSKTRNYHPGQRKSSKFPPKTPKNQTKSLPPEALTWYPAGGLLEFTPGAGFSVSLPGALCPGVYPR